MHDDDAELDFWPTVFSSFRPEDHKFLVVSTANGLEVAVQDISRIEAGLVLIRGRISGTADSGRLFLLPYHQLSSVYVNRPVRTEEVDLYSPSVAPAKKMEVARNVAEIERRAREEARRAEAIKNGDADLNATLKKLDTLRVGASLPDSSASKLEALPSPPSPGGIPPQPPSIAKRIKDNG